MKKINRLWVILDIILLILFTAFFFILGGTVHPIAIWISYGFIHFAYSMLLLTPFLIRQGKRSSVFGFSLYSISGLYFLVELIIGSVFIIQSHLDPKITLLVQLCLAGIYGIILISNLVANENTANAEEARQDQIDFIKDCSANIKLLLNETTDISTRKKIEKLYDTLNASPVKSHKEVDQIEARILIVINELSDAVHSINIDSPSKLAEDIISLINERNMKLKGLN
jgi:hypothetical protein